MPVAKWAQEAKRNATMLIILGVLTVILGVFAISTPFIAGLTVTVFIGFLLLSMGVLQVLAAFKAGNWGAGIAGTIIGVLSIFAGLFMLFRPVAGLATLTLVLAIYFVVDGISEILVAFKMRPEGGWGWMLFNGAIAVLLGIFLWRQWPFSGAYAIGILFGFHILFSGFTMIFVGSGARRIAGVIDDTAHKIADAVEDATEEAYDTAKDVGEAAGDVVAKAKDLVDGDRDRQG